jgi:hypothetical protein
MPTFLAASLKISPRLRHDHRLVRIFVLARSFERVAAVLDCPAQVAGLARGAAELFEAVEMRLQLVIGDTEILDRQIGGDRVAAIALG